MTRASIDIAAELLRLEALTNFELRGEWRRLHHVQPPKSLSRDLLLRGMSRPRTRPRFSLSIGLVLLDTGRSRQKMMDRIPSDGYRPHLPPVADVSLATLWWKVGQGDLEPFD